MLRAGHGRLLVRQRVRGRRGARARASAAASVVIVDATRDDAAATLRHWVRERGARGVRLFTVTSPEASWLDEPAGIRLWEEAQRLGIPVVVTILARQIPKLAGRCDCFPDAAVALDHCGFPDLRGGAPYARAAALLDLAAFPNLRLKVTTHVLRLAEKDGGDPAAVRRPPGSALRSTSACSGDRTTRRRTTAATRRWSRSRDRAAANLAAADRDRLLGGSALELWPELATAGSTTPASA